MKEQLVELRGGPHDGAVRRLPPGFDIFFDDELYIPDETVQPPMLYTYRWLFGEADHLDYAHFEILKL